MKEIKIYTTNFCPYCVMAKKSADQGELGLFRDLAARSAGTPGEALARECRLANSANDIYWRRVYWRVSRSCENCMSLVAS